MKTFTYFDMAAMLGMTAFLTFVASFFTPLNSSVSGTSAMLAFIMLVHGWFDSRRACSQP